MKTILEPAKEIPVVNESDVGVVGGGVGGLMAALAAARTGAKTLLIERFAVIGGVATAGLMTSFNGFRNEHPPNHLQTVRGLAQELVDRLLDSGGACACTAHGNFGPMKKGESPYAVSFDSEILKRVALEMLCDAGVDLMFHTTFGDAITEDRIVKAILIENKSGRQAIQGRVYVDATGDGDIFASAGADFDATLDPNLRSSKLALVFRVGNINHEKLRAFKGKETQTTSIYETGSEENSYAKLMGELNRLGGFTVTMPTPRKDVVWFNNWIPDLSCLNVKDLSRMEVETRKKMLLTHKFYRENVPGFEDSYILDTASQVGTRGSRRLIGEHILTEEELRAGTLYEDTIALFPPLTANASSEKPNRCIPYRSLVPRNVEGLLVAGRCFSSDLVANDIMNLIPPCVAMGEAAGTSAALCAKEGVAPRDVDYSILRKHLLGQGVPLSESP